MAGPLNVVGMAKVLTGWSGSLSVTVGATTVAVPVDTRTSVIVLAQRITAVARGLGVSVEAYATAAGVLTWAAASTISINASGVIATRMSLAATTTGTTLSGTGAHADGFYPGHGMRIEAPADSTTLEAPTAAGGYTAAPVMTPRPVSLRAYGVMADMWTHAADFGGDVVWDVWGSPGYWGRLRVDAVRRDRMGKAADAASLVMSGRSYLWQVPA